MRAYIYDSCDGTTYCTLVIVILIVMMGSDKCWSWTKRSYNDIDDESDEIEMSKSSKQLVLSYPTYECVHRCLPF